MHDLCGDTSFAVSKEQRRRLPGCAAEQSVHEVNIAREVEDLAPLKVGRESRHQWRKRVEYGCERHSIDRQQQRVCTRTELTFVGRDARHASLDRDQPYRQHVLGQLKIAFRAPETHMPILEQREHAHHLDGEIAPRNAGTESGSNGRQRLPPWNVRPRRCETMSQVPGEHAEILACLVRRDPGPIRPRPLAVESPRNPHVRTLAERFGTLFECPNELASAETRRKPADSADVPAVLDLQRNERPPSRAVRLHEALEVECEAIGERRPFLGDFVGYEYGRGYVLNRAQWQPMAIDEDLRGTGAPA